MASGGPGPGVAEHQSPCGGGDVPAGSQPAALPAFSLHEPKGRGFPGLRLVLSTPACAPGPCRAHPGPRRAAGSARPTPLRALAFGSPPPTFPLSFISWFPQVEDNQERPLRAIAAGPRGGWDSSDFCSNFRKVGALLAEQTWAASPDLLERADGKGSGGGGWGEVPRGVGGSGFVRPSMQSGGGRAR